MEQLEFFTIPSPCVGVCEADGKGFCKGCLRSRDERLYWLKLNDAQKRQVMRLIALRRRKFEKAQREEANGLAPPTDQMDLGF